MTYRAVYSRYMTQYADEFPTLREAIECLSMGRDDGYLWPLCIVEPDGTVLTATEVDEDSRIPNILKSLNIPFTDKRGMFKFIDY